MSASIKRKEAGIKEGRTLHCICGGSVGQQERASAVLPPSAVDASSLERVFCLSKEAVVEYTLGTVVRGAANVGGSAVGSAATGDAGGRAPVSGSGLPSEVERRVQRLEAEMFKAQCLIVCLGEQVQALKGTSPPGGLGLHCVHAVVWRRSRHTNTRTHQLADTQTHRHLEKEKETGRWRDVAMGYGCVSGRDGIVVALTEVWRGGCLRLRQGTPRTS